MNNSIAIRALLILEILGNILFHFSNDKDLFTVLAVNHTWRTEGFRALIKLYEFCFIVWIERFNNVSPFGRMLVKNCLRSIYSQVSEIFCSVNSLTFYKPPILDNNFSENLGDILDEYIYFLKDIDDKINITSDYVLKLDFYDNEEDVKDN